MNYLVKKVCTARNVIDCLKLGGMGWLGEGGTSYMCQHEGKMQMCVATASAAIFSLFSVEMPRSSHSRPVDV